MSNQKNHLFYKSRYIHSIRVPLLMYVMIFEDREAVSRMYLCLPKTYWSNFWQVKDRYRYRYFNMNNKKDINLYTSLNKGVCDWIPTVVYSITLNSYIRNTLWLPRTSQTYLQYEGLNSDRSRFFRLIPSRLTSVTYTINVCKRY